MDVFRACMLQIGSENLSRMGARYPGSIFYSSRVPTTAIWLEYSTGISMAKHTSFGLLILSMRSSWAWAILRVACPPIYPQLQVESVEVMPLAGRLSKGRSAEPQTCSSGPGFRVLGHGKSRRDRFCSILALSAADGFLRVRSRSQIARTHARFDSSSLM